MDITLAKQIVEAAIKTRTEELDVLKLASEIINNTFSAEFTSITTAQNEASRLAAEKNEVIFQKTELQATLDSKETEITTLKNEKAFAQEAIVPDVVNNL